MKSTSLKELYKILLDCYAVELEEGVIVYPSISDLNGEADNEFLFLCWDGQYQGEHGSFYLKFAEGDNQEISIDGDHFWLTDNEGDDIPIVPLQKLKI